MIETKIICDLCDKQIKSKGDVAFTIISIILEIKLEMHSGNKIHRTIKGDWRMNFIDAMCLLKAGKKVTRDVWRNEMHFVIEDGAVRTYRPFLTHYMYTEDIMVSDGWVSDMSDIPKTFSEIIEDFQKGCKAWIVGWVHGTYVYLDQETGLVLHQMDTFAFNPNFDDFKAKDWIVV